MDILDFWANLIDIGSPWTVKRVVSEVGTEKVDVHLECADAAQLQCPICNRDCPAADYSPLRTWRHLDACGKAIYLHARPPIVDCPEHGEQPLCPPWGDMDSPFTLAFERLLFALAGELGDIAKATHFLGVGQAHARQIQQRRAKETEKLKSRADDVGKPAARRPLQPRMKQPSIFEQSDMSFANRGIRAFRGMDMEKAVDLLQKHVGLYPKGYDVSSRLALAEFLLRGFRETPADASERPGYLCRLWNSFEDYVKSDHMRLVNLVSEVREAFFSRVIAAVEPSGLYGASFLPGKVPPGYILLQAGRYDEAIRSLQASIASAPHDAALFGYLGDAYWGRGDPRTARQCYREACLIDPAGIDWRCLRDEHLHELKQDLRLFHGADPHLLTAWLPSHARINGLFERKVVRLHDGLKELVDDYLALEKAVSAEKSPVLAAGLFFRGIILCENRESLRFIKKIDLIQVRAMMKRTNPDLFADFMENIVDDKG